MPKLKVVDRTSVHEVAPTTSLETLAERVAYLLASRKMMFIELDQVIHQGSGYTSRLVSGEKKHPHPTSLLKIAQHFGVDVAWLIDGRCPMRPVPHVADVYPSRGRVVLAARQLDWMFSKDVIASIEQVRLPNGTPDPGGPFWWDELRRSKERQQELEVAVARAQESILFSAQSPRSHKLSAQATSPTSPPSSSKKLP